MKRKIVVIFLILVVITFGIVVFLNLGKKEQTKEISSSDINSNQESTMQITSSAFENNQKIPVKYTCDGENIGPPLNIADVPTDAKSLALIVEDPDAPNGNWVHFLLWNIDPSISEIAKNNLPSGSVSGTNSFGRTGYGAPCPPSGTHRYFFKLYALDTILSLDQSATKSDLLKAMENHILDQAEFVGLYR